MTDTSTPIAWQNAAKRAVKAGISAEHLGGEQWRVGSASRPGETYLVTVRRNARGFVRGVSCSCLGAMKEGNVCLHMGAVVLVAPALEIVP